MKTELAINGIIVQDKNDVAFYDIFNNKVTLASCYDKETDEESSRKDYFIKREKQLTERYGSRYCPKNSRLMIDGKCDVCSCEGGNMKKKTAWLVWGHDFDIKDAELFGTEEKAREAIRKYNEEQADLEPRYKTIFFKGEIEIQ